MRLKKFGALLLAGAMMTGTIGVMSPTQAKAATLANTYTMKVPANVDIQNSGWNSLGNIQITGSVDSGKKVTVTAATTNDFALKNGNNSVSYTLKKAENDTNATTSFEFDAASINAEGGASQAIGVDVADFAGKPAGNYTDTITFTGTMDAGSSSGGGTGSGEKTPGDILTCDNLEISFVLCSAERFKSKLINNHNGTFTFQYYRCEDNGKETDVDTEDNYASLEGNIYEQTLGVYTLKIYIENKTYEWIAWDTTAHGWEMDKNETHIKVDGVEITDQFTDTTARPN